MKHIIAFSFGLTTFLGFAQTNVNIDFRPHVGGNYLNTNTVVQNLSGIEMTIDYFNYYISNVHIIHDGGQDLNLSDTVFIVKAEDHVLELGMLNVTNIESINFGVGVPQSINHADISQYSEDNPLSWQNPSMHWGWTSGYKFLLVDGYGDSNNDGTADALFQVHCLGDGNYKNVSMAVIPTVTATETSIAIDCNLDYWLYGFHPGTGGVHHGTTGVNVSVMNNVDNRPVFTLPGNAGIEDPTMENGSIHYTIANDLVTFAWTDVLNSEQYKLINVAGKVIADGKVSSVSGSETVAIQQSGTYFFYLMDANGSIVNHIQVIR